MTDVDAASRGGVGRSSATLDIRIDERLAYSNRDGNAITSKVLPACPHLYGAGQIAACVRLRCGGDLVQPRGFPRDIPQLGLQPVSLVIVAALPVVEDQLGQQGFAFLQGAERGP